VSVGQNRFFEILNDEEGARQKVDMIMPISATGLGSMTLKLYLMTLSLKKFVSGLQKPQSV
jgi:hypothetical protein